MTLRADLADAAARRAALIDRYQMRDRDAECAMCRARGLAIAAVALATAGVIVVDVLRRGRR